jgi:type I restriction enzyme S subunit
MIKTATTDEPKKLPDGWHQVRLGEVCKLVNGDAYRDSDWTPEGMRIVRIQNLNDLSKPFNHWAGPLDNRVCVKTGDVLLAWSGTPGSSFGAHSWTRGDAVLNQHIFRVDRDLDELAPQWAVFAINQQLDVMIGKAHGGVGLRHVTKGQVESLSLLLPPLSEQQRIAEVLRGQMATVEKARVAAQARLEAVKALPAAFLRQVFPQPGQPLPDGWRWVRLGEVCRDISDGTHFTPTYVSEGVPFLSVKDVREKRLSFTDCRYITKEQHLNFCRRCKPEKGDVLYTKVGTTGIAKAIDIDVEFSIFVSVALLKLQSTIIPNYLEKVLNAPVCRTQAENLTQGMANRNLVLKDLKLIILPIPPLDDQERIAAELSGQMASVENARMAAQEELNTINALPAALLRRAFAGEL